MINIIVWDKNYVDIENKSYQLNNQESTIVFLKELLDKVYYGGERVCLESAKIDSERGCAEYDEIDRWS